jgi:hypothetical protein
VRSIGSSNDGLDDDNGKQYTSFPFLPLLFTHSELESCATTILHTYPYMPSQCWSTVRTSKDTISFFQDSLSSTSATVVNGTSRPLPAPGVRPSRALCALYSFFLGFTLKLRTDNFSDLFAALAYAAPLFSRLKEDGKLVERYAFRSIDNEDAQMRRRLTPSLTHQAGRSGIQAGSAHDLAVRRASHTLVSLLMIHVSQSHPPSRIRLSGRLWIITTHDLAIRRTSHTGHTLLHWRTGTTWPFDARPIRSLIGAWHHLPFNRLAQQRGQPTCRHRWNGHALK